jgi:dienelactone hydrolase
MLELIPFSAPTYWLNYNAVLSTAGGSTMGDVGMAMRPYLKFVDQHRDFFERAKAEAPLKFDGKYTTVPDDLAVLMFESVPYWTQGFTDHGRALAKLAKEAEAKGRLISAASLYKRSASLLATAEWSMQVGADKHGVFEECRAACMKAIALSGDAYEEVLIPYGEHLLDGIWWPAPGDGPKPVAICFNGLHSYMEWFWQNGMVEALRSRGFSVLTFDCPGSGTARFYKNLHMEPKTEKYAKAALDWVLARADVDPEKLAAVGCSFGGYRTVRAASTDDRFKACLAWGALYEWPQAKQRRDGEPLTAPITMSGLDRPTMFWFNGVETMEDFLELRSQFTLHGVIDGLKCPLIVFHGAEDMQVPLFHAERVIAEAVNAKSKDLAVYYREDGGEQHCHLDNLPTALNEMCDRLAEALGVKAAR